MLILEGQAAAPCALVITGERVEIRDARHLWGGTTADTEDALRAELGMPDTVIASIGPAGERLVRFACIINDKHRAAGRSGVGAVLGSKNMKAIAVRGTEGVALARPGEFLSAMWAMQRKLAVSPGR